MKSNLDRTLDELARTHVVYLVDSQTGAIVPKSLDAYLDDRGRIPKRFHVRASSRHPGEDPRAKLTCRSAS